MVRRLLFVICLIIFVLPTMVSAEQVDDNKYYKLEKVLILSRHNIRAPLSGNDSILSKITTHKWYEWISAPSELSLRGGELETLMGQYFRQWLVKEGFMTENYIPKEGEFLFYANSKQRTVATAQYFSSGMLPIANVKIEHKFAVEGSDPVFSPRFRFMNETFRTEAIKQINEMGGADGLKGIGESLKNDYKILEKVLNINKSEYAKTNDFKGFKTDDTEMILELHKQPAVSGSLKLASQASDALILQCYEEPSAIKAAFNNRLSVKEWEQIGHIKDVYYDVLFTAPIVAVSVAHPLLEVMNDELAIKNRKFTFLCGHDSNISSVLAALDVEDYSLPNTIEKKTPIGSKVVIQKWLGKDGLEYVSLNLVYQSTDQMRNRTMLTLKTPPMSYPLKLKGLSQNADGLYKFSDLQHRFKEAIFAYDELPGYIVNEAA